MPSSRTVSSLFRLPSSFRFGDRQQPSSSIYRRAFPSPRPFLRRASVLRAAPRFACKLTWYSTWTRSGYAFLGCKQQMGTAQAKRLTENLDSALWNGT